MKSSRGLVSLTVYSFAHFAVDFSCAFLLFRLLALGAVPADRAAAWFLLYNALAFGTEFLIGSFFSSRTARVPGVLGCLMIMASCALGVFIIRSLGGYDPETLRASTGLTAALSLEEDLCRVSEYALLAVALAGLGNSCFHVGGGISSISADQTRYWRSGVFISTGAMGLAIGGYLGGNVHSFCTFEFASFILAVCAVLIWMLTGEYRTDSFDVEETGLSSDFFAGRRRISGAETFLTTIGLMGLLYIIFIRSGAGFVAPDLFEEKAGFRSNALILAFGAFLGKFVGGFLADLFGPRRSAVLALLLSIPCLAFCGVHQKALFCGVFLLNSTTAVTLLRTVRYCRGRIGFAFGLTTLALLFGLALRQAAYMLFDGAYGADGVAWALAGVLLTTVPALAFAARPARIDATD